MDTFDLILTTLRDEFSDLPDVAAATRVAARLLLAAALGGMVGFEREHRGKSAGLRTHMLVAMGSALFVLVPQAAGMPLEDLSRVVQGVIAGIGFLGVGTIIKNRHAEEVHGLTTAAGIWMTAAIGVACGLGRELTAILSAVLSLVVLGSMRRWLKPRDD